MQISVHRSGHYYAEVGLDIRYGEIWSGVYIWNTQAYAAYSEDPQGYGAVLAWYDLGYSWDGPTYAQVATYQTSSTTWAWYVNGNVFATHTYPESFQGYATHSVTEAYNQPVSGTSGQLLSDTVDLYIKRADNGYWYPGLYTAGSAQVANGWMVNVAAGNQWRSDASSRP